MNKISEELLCGWSGGAMALGNLPVPGRPTIWMIVGQGPTALAVGAGGGCLDIFTLIYPFSPLSPSLWETARYRPKYCLKGPLNPKQPTNQRTALARILIFGIYRRTSMAPTLMARLPRLFQTRSWVPWNRSHSCRFVII